MCGRFALGLPHHEIQQLHGYPDVQVGEWINQDQFVPRYNVAPRSQAPVLRRADPVPHWSKHEDMSLSNTLRTINARSENLVEGGGMWGSIKGKKRCAVLCQGYYEWLKKGKEKLPHFTRHQDGRIMLLAGLYDSVVLAGQTNFLYTFTIVTTDANKEFSWLHDRQPVILSSQHALETWLDTSSQTWSPELTKLVGPYNDPQCPLECYQVPKEVGKVGTESPTFIQPVAQRKDGIEAMFSKQVHSSAKRKRSASPPPIPSSIQEVNFTGTGDIMDQRSHVERAPVKKTNAWEDKEIEYVDEPSTSGSSFSPKNKGKVIRELNKDQPSEIQSEISPKKSKKAKTSPSKKAQAKKDDGIEKITTFFRKAS